MAGWFGSQNNLKTHAVLPFRTIPKAHSKHLEDPFSQKKHSIHSKLWISQPPPLTLPFSPQRKSQNHWDFSSWCAPHLVASSGGGLAGQLKRHQQNGQLLEGWTEEIPRVFRAKNEEHVNNWENKLILEGSKNLDSCFRQSTKMTNMKMQSANIWRFELHMRDFINYCKRGDSADNKRDWTVSIKTLTNFDWSIINTSAISHISLVVYSLYNYHGKLSWRIPRQYGWVKLPEGNPCGKCHSTTGGKISAKMMFLRVQCRNIL